MNDPVPDPQLARRAQAVRAIRIFLPLYLLGVVTLTLAPLARIAEVDVPGLSVLATASLVTMAVAAPTFLGWLGRLGQYNARTGLAFRLLPAVLRGAYVPVGSESGAPTRARSPLGSLAADALKASADLDAAGLSGLAHTLRAVVGESEIVHLGIHRIAARDDDGASALVAEAEGVQGRFRDTIARLQGAGPVDPGALGEDLESLLGALRGVGDRLRAC